MFRFVSRVGALPVILIYLSACSITPTLMPPSIPSGAELASYSDNDFHAPYKIGNTPLDTLVIGVSYVDEHCSRFFDAVEQMSRETKVAQSVFLTGATQVSLLMNIAKKSALSVAQAAAMIEVTKVLLEQYRQEFTFAPHSVELRSITFQAMTAQKKEFGDLVQQGLVVSHVQVIAAVKKYAQNCTLAQIREHWNNAIAKAVREGVQKEFVDVPRGRGLESLGPIPGVGSRPSNILGVNKYVVR